MNEIVLLRNFVSGFQCTALLHFVVTCTYDSYSTWKAGEFLLSLCIV